MDSSATNALLLSLDDIPSAADGLEAQRVTNGGFSLRNLNGSRVTGSDVRMTQSPALRATMTADLRPVVGPIHIDHEGRLCQPTL